MSSRHSCLMMCAVSALIFFCSDAWALGLGPGGGAIRGGGRGGNNGTRKDPKKEQEERDRETHKQHVQQIPQPEKCAQLDTSAFERLADQLELSKEQEKRIDDLKQRIRDRANELEKAADTTRNNFKNVKEPDCPQAGGALMAAIQACKNYVPSLEFEKAVNLTLNESQRTKLKMLQLNGGRQADAPKAKKDKPNLANE